jgi:dihydrofolate synthase / folylpolyglutamate synthase
LEIKTFQEATTYLQSLIYLNEKTSPPYSQVGLKRMQALMKEMGNPQDSYPTVHVGGTAGKGSTSTMIAAILEEAGYKTGLHVSPHLEDIRERSQVNGMLMPKGEFVSLTNYVKSYIDIVGKKHPYGSPTYFEALVAITLEHFKREKVEIGVIEVGLGGKLDGTNIITPKVAVLTNVGLDHTEILGNTVEKIAQDKSRIFKRGIRVVSGVTQPSVIKIVEAAAKEMGCKLDLLGNEIKFTIGKGTSQRSSFDISYLGKNHKNVLLSALGDHQVRNAALAIAASLNLNGFGFKIKDSDIRDALASITIPGRFEVTGKNPAVVFDGAHNPMKMEALAKTLEQIYPGKKINFVFAAKKGKDVEEMLKPLLKISDKFYLTKFNATTDFGNMMSIEPEELKKLVGGESLCYEDGTIAYRSALRGTPKDGVLCITGSLYLVGELRNYAVAKTERRK